MSARGDLHVDVEKQQIVSREPSVGGEEPKSNNNNNDGDNNDEERKKLPSRKVKFASSSNNNNEQQQQTQKKTARPRSPPPQMIPQSSSVMTQEESGSEAAKTPEESTVIEKATTAAANEEKKEENHHTPSSQRIKSPSNSPSSPTLEAIEKQLLSESSPDVVQLFLNQCISAANKCVNKVYEMKKSEGGGDGNKNNNSTSSKTSSSSSSSSFLPASAKTSVAQLFAKCFGLDSSKMEAISKIVHTPSSTSTPPSSYAATTTVLASSSNSTNIKHQGSNTSTSESRSESSNVTPQDDDDNSNIFGLRSSHPSAASSSSNYPSFNPVCREDSREREDAVTSSTTSTPGISGLPTPNDQSHQISAARLSRQQEQHQQQNKTSAPESDVESTTSVLQPRDKHVEDSTSGLTSRFGSSNTLLSSAVSQQQRSSNALLFSNFVPKLALSSFQLSSMDESIMVPVDVDVAILFVDLSHYSSVSSALEARGAFALFEVVNNYLDELIRVIIGYNGEILKFAGDAIISAFYFPSLKNSVRAATHCAHALQRDCGSFKVPGTEHFFAIHCGIVCGNIRSTVFRSNVRHMQSAFHLISGLPVQRVGDVVDAAAPGEVCVTGDVTEFCCDAFTFKEPSRGKIGDVVQLLVGDGQVKNCQCIVGPDALAELQNNEAARRASAAGDTSMSFSDAFLSEVRPPSNSSGTATASVEEYQNKVSDDIEFDVQDLSKLILSFIPPKLTQIHRRSGQHRQEQQLHFQAFLDTAEMRLICCLFIHKTDLNIDLHDWFEEIQNTVDSHNASIVQIIDDDKGIHAVAAINLQTSDREPAVTGIRLARALCERNAGCTLGIACGVTFCGVIGNEAAARFDIAGFACVRACRLMQFALQRKWNVAIDTSVADFAGDASLVQFRETTTTIKGNHGEAVEIFGLSSTDTSVLGAVTTPGLACDAVHSHLYSEIETFIMTKASSSPSSPSFSPQLSSSGNFTASASAAAGSSSSSSLPQQHTHSPSRRVSTSSGNLGNSSGNFVAPSASVGYNNNGENIKERIHALLQAPVASALSGGGGGDGGSGDHSRNNNNNQPRQRLSVLVHGLSNSGKFILCSRVVYSNRIVGISHMSTQDGKPLDILYTLANWFSHSQLEELRRLSASVQQALQQRHHIRSTMLALQLVEASIRNGLRTAIIVRQAQRLDAMSVSFLRQSVSIAPSEGSGRWLVFICVVPQFGAPQWSQIAAAIHADTMIVRVGHLTPKVAASFIKHQLNWDCHEQLLRSILQVSGYSVGAVDAVVQRVLFLTKQQNQLYNNKKKLQQQQEQEQELTKEEEFFVSRKGGILTAQHEALEKLQLSRWTEISRSVCSKASTLMGNLTGGAAAVLKVVAILDTPFISLNKNFVSVVAPALTKTSFRRSQKLIEFLLDLGLLVRCRARESAIQSLLDNASNEASFIGNNNAAASGAKRTGNTNQFSSYETGVFDMDSSSSTHAAAAATSRPSPSSSNPSATSHSSHIDKVANAAAGKSSGTFRMSSTAAPAPSKLFSYADEEGNIPVVDPSGAVHQHLGDGKTTTTNNNSNTNSNASLLRGERSGERRSSSALEDFAHVQVTEEDEDSSLTDDFFSFESPATLHMILNTTLPRDFAIVSKLALQLFPQYYDLSSPEACFCYSSYALLANEMETYREYLQKGKEILADAEEELLDEAEEAGLIDSSSSSAAALLQKQDEEEEYDGEKRSGCKHNNNNNTSATAAATATTITTSVSSATRRSRNINSVVFIANNNNNNNNGGGGGEIGDNVTQVRIRTTQQLILNLKLQVRVNLAASSLRRGDIVNFSKFLHETNEAEEQSFSKNEFVSLRYSEADSLPHDVVELRNFLPPVSLGVMTQPMRLVSHFLTILAVHASSGTDTSYSMVKERHAVIGFFCKLAQQIDRCVGFKRPAEIQNENEFLTQLVVPGTYESVISNARKFLVYVETVLGPRVKKIHEHVLSNTIAKGNVPMPPSYKCVFDGEDRIALEGALTKCIAKWKTSKVEALRDGLMQQSVYGWIAKNNRLSIECQIDMYLRTRSESLDCYIAFLFVNLSVSHI